MPAQHLYLAGTCKNPTCHALCMFKYLGVDVGQSAKPKLESDGFQYLCISCNWEYQYKQPDLRPVRLGMPPLPDWKNSF